jgi:hypothetical protein
MLLQGIFDVFIVRNIVEEICVNKTLDIIFIVDMSDIIDTTDVSDYIDYLSFENDASIEEDKYFLHKYFEEFVKLFRKDCNISIEPIHYVEYNVISENFDYQHINIYKEILKHEVLRLNKDLCFADKEIYDN